MVSLFLFCFFRSKIASKQLGHPLKTRCAFLKCPLKTANKKLAQGNISTFGFFEPCSICVKVTRGSTPEIFLDCAQLRHAKNSRERLRWLRSDRFFSSQVAARPRHAGMPAPFWAGPKKSQRKLFFEGKPHFLGN